MLPPGTAELLSTMAQVELTVGCRIVFEAIDPTSGAAISGVKIVNPTVYGVDLSPSNAGEVPSGPLLLVPGPPQV